MKFYEITHENKPALAREQNRYQKIKKTIKDDQKLIKKQPKKLQNPNPLYKDSVFSFSSKKFKFKNQIFEKFSLPLTFSDQFRTPN